MSRSKNDLWTFHIDNLSMNEALSTIVSASGFHYTVTPNVDHVIRYFEDTSFRQYYASSSLCLCDSRILAICSRLFGIKQNVTPGSDLTELFLKDFASPTDNICIVGPSRADFLKLEAIFPHLNFSHVYPPHGFEKNSIQYRNVIKEIEDTSSDYIILGIGSPKQERIAFDLQRNGTMNCKALCVGASIDFLVGRQIRAPKFIQRLGCEWLYRLVKDPRRLYKRYLVRGPRFIFILLLLLWKKII